MFGINLSDTRTLIPLLSSSKPHSLYSAADSDPEPVTTLSVCTFAIFLRSISNVSILQGVQPDRAPFDQRTPSPVIDPPPSPEGSVPRYNLRATRFLTEKGAAFSPLSCFLSINLLPTRIHRGVL